MTPRDLFFLLLAFKAFPALHVLQKDARSPWGTLGATWMGTSLAQTLRKHKSTSFLSSGK